MRRYDPSRQPAAEAWLALDEDERYELVRAYHRKARAKIPGLRLHVAIHVIVENQIAEEIPAVTNTLRRLIAEGLDRHDAIHAIGSVLLEHMHALLSGADPDERTNETYYDGLRAFDARRWLAEWSDSEPRSR